MELVIAEGKRINGSAIPVRTPYTLRASEGEKPKARSRSGIHMASVLAKRFSTSRVPIRGKAAAINGRNASCHG